MGQRQTGSWMAGFSTTPARPAWVTTASLPAAICLLLFAWNRCRQPPMTACRKTHSDRGHQQPHDYDPFHSAVVIIRIPAGQDLDPVAPKIVRTPRMPAHNAPAISSRARPFEDLTQALPFFRRARASLHLS